MTASRQEHMKASRTGTQTLVNIFSREKSLLYFCVWDDSDRRGIELIGQHVRNSLFVIPPKGRKGSVWYERGELQFLKGKTIEAFRTRRSAVWQTIATLADESWRFLRPYATGKKRIRHDREFAVYYEQLVNFWVCLNSFVYEILEDGRVDRSIRKKLVVFRDSTERYTETMSQLLTDYVEQHPKLKKVAFVITKDEALDVIHGRMSRRALLDLQARRRGCFMLNGVVFPITKLTTTLKGHDLALEQVDTKRSEISGASAYGGRVQGPVKIIHGFADLDKVIAGDVLVTQMTNPNYLSAIAKSSAVVTDEGGMLCHAAIVARELKKPCVIGTKVATKVLKDGDMVEVDAHKGIVRKLKRGAT